MSQRLCAVIVLAGVFGTTPLWAAQTQPPSSRVFGRFDDPK